MSRFGYSVQSLACFGSKCFWIQLTSIGGIYHWVDPYPVYMFWWAFPMIGSGSNLPVFQAFPIGGSGSNLPVFQAFPIGGSGSNIQVLVVFCDEGSWIQSKKFWQYFWMSRFGYSVQSLAGFCSKCFWIQPTSIGGIYHWVDPYPAYSFWWAFPMIGSGSNLPVFQAFQNGGSGSNLQVLVEYFIDWIKIQPTGFDGLSQWVDMDATFKF